MADEKINSTANNIKINIDNLSYVDYLWTQRTSDNAIQGIRLDRRNLPLNLNADKLGGKDPSYYLNYNNLTNKPTIPTVNNGTLTIQKNGTNVKTFTANQSSNVTANITVPTKVSDLSDASNYINTSNTAQAKTGDLTLSGALYNGPAKPSGGNVVIAPPVTAQNRASYMTGVNIVSGARDDFYCANLRTNFWKHSAKVGTHNFTEWESGALYNGVGSDGLYFKLADYPISDSTPLVIQICSGDDTNGYKFVDHTDVMQCMLHAHTFTRNYYFLTKYKVEVLGKAGYNSAVLPASELTWYTIIDRSNVHDDIEGLTFRPDNQSVTGSGYISFRGLRITIYGVQTNDTHWRISAIQMLNQRGAGVPASAVGALPLSGGDVWGPVNINNYLYVNNSLRTRYIYPEITGSYNIGHNNYRYNEAHINTIYENGTSLVNKYAAKSHTHNYAGSDSAGGAANSVKKNLTIGGVIYNGSTAVNIPYGSGIMEISSTTSTPGTISQLSRADHIHKIDLATGDSNGQVKIAGTNIDVKGLGSAAYTNSNDYATPDWTKEHWAKEINTQDVRIWGLDQGIYKLTYGMDSTTPKDHIVNIYYNGETGTEKKSISPTPLYLYVDAVNATAATRMTSWRLYLHSGTIFKGRTTSKTGTIEQGWAISYITKLNGATTANAIYAPTTSGTSGQILQSNGDSLAPTWVDIPIRTYEGPTYGTCYTIDAPNGNYSMQIGDSGFTVDSSTPDGQPSNILQVNENTFIYNDSETVLHTGNATKMASFYAHSANSYVDIRTNQGSLTTNGITIIERGQISLAGVTNLSLAHSMPNTNYALFFTEVHASANTVYTPIVRSKTTTGFSVYLGSGGLIYDYVAIYVG